MAGSKRGATQKVIARDCFGNNVLLDTFVDNGVRYKDISTDGRCMLTVDFAEELGKWLLEYAKREAAKRKGVK